MRNGLLGDDALVLLVLLVQQDARVELQLHHFGSVLGQLFVELPGLEHEAVHPEGQAVSVLLLGQVLHALVLHHQPPRRELFVLSQAHHRKGGERSFGLEALEDALEAVLLDEDADHFKVDAFLVVI